MTTNVDELLKDKKRQREGRVCTVDKCFSPSGKIFEVDGEFCSECLAGVIPDDLRKESVLTEINLLRESLGEKPLTS